MKWKNISTRYGILLAPLGLLLALVCVSDRPPFGYVWNEFNTVYWGIVVNIAEKWRAWDFSFWDSEVGGGASLYTSGFYPIFNPTNALAFFLNNDQFFFFKIIEPFAFGFLTMILLLRYLKVEKIYSLCAALAYLGLIFTKWTNIAVHSVFMWGPVLFPLMIHLYLKHLDKDKIYLAAAAVGMVLTLQFLTNGMIEIIQILLWWACFFFTKLLVDRCSWSVLWRTLKTYVLMVAVFFSLSAFQLLPTAAFVLLDGARGPGRYPMNTFPLWRDTTSAEFPSLRWIIHQNVGWGRDFNSGWFFLIVMVVLILLNIRRSENRILRKNFKFLCAMWGGTLLYLVLPTFAETASAWHPFILKLFQPFTTINFSYGLYTLDFMLVLTVCLLIGGRSEGEQKGTLPHGKKWAGYVTVLLAIGMSIFLTVTFFQVISKKPLDNLSYWLFTRGEKFFILLSAWSALGLGFLNYSGTRKNIAKAVFIAVLIWAGWASLVGFYYTLGRGKQIPEQKQQFETPEHRYFASARGQYCFPAAHQMSCVTMMAHYNLLYGVRSITRYLPVASYRFARFQAHYHRIPEPGNWVSPEYWLLNPSANLASRFPVDFTFIERGKKLGWPGFTKTVSGQQCDIWQKDSAPQRVRFADKMKILYFDEIVNEFDAHRFDGTIVVEKADAEKFGISSLNSGLQKGAGESQYFNYEDFRKDHILFDVETVGDVFVVVPQMFHHGWQAWIDGQRAAIFPADYIFLGLRLSPGFHKVELKYYPPLILWGVLISIIGWFSFLRIFCCHCHALPWRKEKQFYEHQDS